MEKLKSKRAVFTDTDTKLLVDCLKKHANIINNRKTNGITPKMKMKAWESILTRYNSSQTGGEKSLTEIQKKYKNMKCIAKKETSNLIAFDFNGKQIDGFHYPFDSDPLNRFSAADDEQNDDDNKFWSTDEATTSSATPVSNKKMRMSVGRLDLVALKEEGMMLDLECKKLDIEGKKLFIESMKLDIAIKKEQLDKVKTEES